MRNVIYTLEVWSTPGGYRLAATLETLKGARALRDTTYYSCVKTRIRRWEPK